jgi:protoheme IX farnesyltransferase
MNSGVEILDQRMVRARWRLISFIELMKPELTALSVLTALSGFYLAATSGIEFWPFLWTGVGTLLVGGGAGALNQYVERDYDAMMRRTERRPLPAGRVSPPEVFWFGTVLSFAGIALLALGANLLTSFLGTVTITTYLFLYTPLKRITPFATLVGGIPGALPPMMGWAAARNEISLPSVVLFAILFFWQIPHFHSLSWVYRKDYARAGFKMLTVLDDDGSRTSRQILICVGLLLPASFGLTIFGVTGYLYLMGAAVLGIVFLTLGVMFAKASGNSRASAVARCSLYSRRMFTASLVYLTALMFLMAVDKV